MHQSVALRRSKRMGVIKGAAPPLIPSLGAGGTEPDITRNAESQGRVICLTLPNSIRISVVSASSLWPKGLLHIHIRGRSPVLDRVTRTPTEKKWMSCWFQSPVRVPTTPDLPPQLWRKLNKRVYTRIIGSAHQPLTPTYSRWRQ